jgi:hypothetical protein
VILTSNDYNSTFIGSLLTSGALLLFVPDRFINALEKKVLGKEIKLPFQNSKPDENTNPIP